jgi:hypothetical protein
MPKPLIFISHAHEEQAVAVFLETELRRMFLGGLDFFVSSDRRILRGGDEFLQKIKDALGRASVVLALLSPRSVDRAWISFESGAAWLRSRVVPLCHSGLKPSQLPQPLQSLIGFDLHEAIDLHDLCELLGEAASLSSPDADWHALASSLGAVVAELGPLRPKPYGAAPCWVFPRSEDVGTVSSLEKSLDRARRVVIYAVGTNFLWSGTHLETLEHRLTSGHATARICMANFSSEAIQRRMSEEPEHPIGVPGSEHLIRRLVAIEARVADSERFAIKVFSHYPTYAMLGFDDELYVYPYGYRTLGNYSPTFYWRGADPAIEFFTLQFERVWSDATPATEIYGT